MPISPWKNTETVICYFIASTFSILHLLACLLVSLIPAFSLFFLNYVIVNQSKIIIIITHTNEDVNQFPENNNIFYLLAGAGGIEPPVVVLETTSLPLTDAPINLFIKNIILYDKKKVND